MAVEEEKALHNVMITSALVFIIMAMLLFGVLASPALSPVSAIADWDGDGFKNRHDLYPRDPTEWADSDGDGVGDNTDAFPDDPAETSDLDGDGFGDNEDIFDGGDALLRISLKYFEMAATNDNHPQGTDYRFAWFRVFVDMDADDHYDKIYNSTVMNATNPIVDFFSLVLEVADDATSFRFMVVAYDVTSVSPANVTDHELLDYNPASGLKTRDHVVSLPCDLSWALSGLGDEDLPDCVIGYSVAVFARG